MPSHTTRVLMVILMKMFIFLFFWMRIILRLICVILSRRTVTISFLWCRRHCVYATASFAAIDTSWYLRVVHALLFFCIWTSYLTQSDYLVLFLNFSTAPVPLKDIKTFKQESTFKQIRVNFFFCENMTSLLNYVTATLRTLFAPRGSYNFSIFCKTIVYV